MTTRYDGLIQQVENYRTARDEITGRLSDPEEVLRQRMENLDSDALFASELAQAEQQRIANLLTVALDTHSPVGGGRFPLEAKRIALAEALTALGLPLESER